MKEENNRPGVSETEFIITIGNIDEDKGIDLVLGEDITIIDGPDKMEDGWKYTLKVISDRAAKYFDTQINNEG